MLVRSARTVTMVLLVATLGSLQAARAEEAAVPLVLNIHIDQRLRPAVAEMLRSSETFRQQWTTLARSHRVHVTVFMTDGPIDRTCRAKTTIRKYSSGLLFAIVQIPPRGDYTELVAHEFEHVLEQIDGVDLAALVRSGSTSVRQRADGAFETARAQRAGLAVAAEVRWRAE